MKSRFLSPVSGLLKAAGRVTGCCRLPVAALLTVLALAGGCAAPDTSKRERAVFNVADYGAEGDGQTLNIAENDNRLDLGPGAGGGGVIPSGYVPCGRNDGGRSSRCESMAACGNPKQTMNMVYPHLTPPTWASA